MSAQSAAEDVRVCIPLDVVQAMVRLLEEEHHSEPSGTAYVLRALKAEAARIDGPVSDAENPAVQR
ncbi:MAG: hypothetical protein ACRDV9_12455 [Acidimicrobiia bacterium]